MLYLGVNSFSAIFGFYMLNIKASGTFFLHLLYTMVTFYFSYKISEAELVINAYKYTQLAWFLANQPIFYFEEYASKINFLNQLKIKRLIKESRNIVETLPDGLIIHQEKGNQIDIKYLNSTFHSMFFGSTESRSRINQSGNDSKTLNKIYLRKTQYVIKNQKVEQEKEFEIEEPKSIIQQIQNLQSGQVFEIIYKDAFSGNFISSDMV